MLNFAGLASAPARFCAWGKFSAKRQHGSAFTTVTGSARGAPAFLWGILGGAQGSVGVHKMARKIVILRCRMGMTILESPFTGALPDGLILEE